MKELNPNSRQLRVAVAECLWAPAALSYLFSINVDGINGSLELGDETEVALPQSMQVLPSTDPTVVAARLEVRSIINASSIPNKGATLAWFDSSLSELKQTRNGYLGDLLTKEGIIGSFYLNKDKKLMSFDFPQIPASTGTAATLSPEALLEIAKSFYPGLSHTDFIYRIEPWETGAIDRLGQFRIKQHLKLQPNVKVGFISTKLELYPGTGGLKRWVAPPLPSGPSAVRPENVKPRFSRQQLEQTALELYLSVAPFGTCRFGGDFMFVSAEFRAGGYRHEMTPNHLNLADNNLGLTMYVASFIDQESGDLQYCFVDSLTNKPLAWKSLGGTSLRVNAVRTPFDPTDAKLKVASKSWMPVALEVLNQKGPATHGKPTLIQSGNLLYFGTISNDQKLLLVDNRTFQLATRSTSYLTAKFPAFGIKRKSN